MTVFTTYLFNYFHHFSHPARSDCLEYFSRGLPKPSFCLRFPVIVRFSDCSLRLTFAALVDQFLRLQKFLGKVCVIVFLYSLLNTFKTTSRCASDFLFNKSMFCRLRIYEDLLRIYNGLLLVFLVLRTFSSFVRIFIKL